MVGETKKLKVKTKIGRNRVFDGGGPIKRPAGLTDQQNFGNSSDVWIMNSLQILSSKLHLTANEMEKVKERIIINTESYRKSST